MTSKIFQDARALFNDTKSLAKDLFAQASIAGQDNPAQVAIESRTYYAKRSVTSLASSIYHAALAAFYSIAALFKSSYKSTRDKEWQEAKSKGVSSGFALIGVFSPIQAQKLQAQWIQVRWEKVGDNFVEKITSFFKRF